MCQWYAVSGSPGATMTYDLVLGMGIGLILGQLFILVCIFIHWLKSRLYRRKQEKEVSAKRAEKTQQWLKE